MNQFFLKYFLAFFPSMRLVTAVAAGLAAITSTAFAVVYNTPLAGGTGGTYYSLSCGDKEALVGIKGKAGSWLDSVQGVCAQINYDGTWQGAADPIAIVGGSGGTSYNLTCPSGYAVTGIKGKAGSYVDQLKVRCGMLGQDGRFSILGNFLNAAGGGGGSSFGPYDCTDSKPARLIRVRASTWVDAIGLGCEKVKTLKVHSVGVSQYPVRVGQATPATVTMSLKPAANASVSLASGNSSIAPVSSSLTVGTSATQGTVSITPTAPGCASITASYKGSSYSSSKMIVHSATSPFISLTTPTEIRTGSTATVTVTIPSPAPSVGTNIVLTSLDTSILTVPTFIRIPNQGVSSGFQVTAGQTQGCARIKASTGQQEVTHTIRVVP